MATVETKRLTAEEFWEWVNRPENLDKLFELDRGEVVEVTRPAEFHGVLCAWIAHLLWRYVLQRRRGCVCSNDTGLLVARDPDTLRGPDVMFIDEPLGLDQLSRKFTQRIPKLLIEVMSPNDRLTQLNRRIGQYLERGVGLVWLVDAEVRGVTVYRRDRYPLVLDDTEELTGEDVLPDLRLAVSELFTLPAEQTASPEDKS
ncbi:MAG TPA: Uma2 family endonuclease [Gemmataceae bacterium]|nr:Uma2 family endonuclease [Gemmataceae bacterium]